MSACAVAALCTAHAEDIDNLPDWPGEQPLNTYGHTGLLEMPSARMMDDGEFSVTFASAPESFRTALSFQIFPWLEAAFRYSRINDYFAGSETATRDDLLDRSFSLKLRLMDETEYLPAVAIGFNDLLGTGIYGGEYLVASKAFGDFDVTLGLGWGRMGSTGMFRNPFSYFDDRFDDRPVYDPRNDQGGTPIFNSVFRGEDSSLFGGIVWQTPIEGLKAIVEYSGDAYRSEESRDIYKPESQVNFGLSYEINEFSDLSAGYLYGDTFNFRFSIRFDPTTETMKVVESPPTAPAVRPEGQRPRPLSNAAPAGMPQAIIDLRGLRGVQLASAGGDWSLSDYGSADDVLLAQAGMEETSASSGAPSAPQPGSMQDIMVSGQWYQVPAIRKQIIDSVVKAAREQHLGLEAIDLKPNYVSIYYENKRYVRDTDVIHRLMRIMTTLPPSVEYFYLTSIVEGFPSTEILVSRTAYERAVQQFSAVDNLVDYARIQAGGMEIPDDAINFGEDYPRFDWSLVPGFRTLLFDPDQPIRVGVTLELSGSVEFEGGWKAETVLSSDLFDTIDDPEPGNSVLPHVRTDFRLYRDEGQHGIQSMLVQKTGKFSPEVFYQVKAGLLEDMYGGIGGEVVWRPEGSDIAYGANLYYVKQREFDRLFGFRDYDVVTGQASIYWQNALWRGMNVNVHAGRYLAGDWGATFEVTRRFDSGVEIGAFATFTDVPFDDFGEGSFDKGLIIRIPFGWITPFNTQLEAGTNLSSLIRDGGQRLYERNPLYESLRRTNEPEIRRTWPLDVTPGL